MKVVLTIDLPPTQIVSEVPSFGIQHTSTVEGRVRSCEWFVREEGRPLESILDAERRGYRRR